MTGVSSKLIIDETVTGDFGVYNCTTVNSYGSHSAEIILEMHSKYKYMKRKPYQKLQAFNFRRNVQMPNYLER